MKRSMAALLAACLVIAQGAPLPVRAAGEAAGNAYDDMSDQVTARNLENAMESTDSGASGEDPEVLISFSPAQWARMADIRTHVWVQYEDVWLDMGESAQYTINEDGQLISVSVRTSVTIDSIQNVKSYHPEIPDKGRYQIPAPIMISFKLTRSISARSAIVMWSTTELMLSLSFSQR